MKPWLYPISAKKKEYTFHDSQGHRLGGGGDGFRRLISSGKQKDEWSLWAHFDDIAKGDEVFVYTGDKNMGIIGYARVVGKQREEDKKSILLRFDMNRTNQLLRDPIPANLVRQHMPEHKFAVMDFTSHLPKIGRYLPWNPSVNREERAMLSPLNLKPYREVYAKIRSAKRKQRLIHDTILAPVGRFLKSYNFVLGGQTFRRLRVDMVGMQNQEVVIVEGKVNFPSEGRKEAREGLGQLLEYSWWFKQKSAVYRSTLWLAFQNRPHPDVVRFLEDQTIVVSWTRNSTLVFSRESEKYWREKFQS